MNYVQKKLVFVRLSALSILGFASIASAATTPVTLRWTAPGDDGTIGRATRYDLRYSTLPITVTNFPLARGVPNLPVPLPAGSPESFIVNTMSPDTTYYLAIKASDEAGNWSAISNVVLRPAQTLGVNDSTYMLTFSNPWPNPSRQTIRCAFALPQAGPVRVDVFDIAGRHVRTVADRWHDAGRGEASWDLRDEGGNRVNGGVYLVRARIADQAWTRRVTVLI